MRAIGLICLLPLSVTVLQAADREPIRLGMIGVDTSHARAFTKLFNATDPAEDLSGFRVVAAYPRGSWDIHSSVIRIPKNTQEMRDLGVEIVSSIAELVAKVDAVLLETNDGRPHLEQALPVLRARKPLFIDKPVAASLTDTLAIYQLAKHFDAPVFTSSSLRYTEGAQAIRAGSLGQVLGAEVHSPATLEPTHPDLFWYGIHGVEPLFTVMGTGCQSVVRVHTAAHDLVVGTWSDGRIGTFRGLRDGQRGYGGTGFGTKGIAALGNYAGYRALVVEVGKFFRTRVAPVSPQESIEIYAFMAAADESKRRGGASVSLSEILSQSQPTIHGDIVVDSAYPGGNATIDRVEGDTIHLHPDLRDTTTWWFYWNFRVRGAAGRSLKFQFPERSPIGLRGPAVSTDHGKNWAWLGSASVSGSSFQYTFGQDSHAVRFAFAIPYQDADLRRFLETHAENPHLEVTTLSSSRRHRVVERLRFGRLDGAAEHRLFFTARHHACETMASYALEGIIAAVLEDTEDGRWLREHVECLAIPFVDKDGVEEGDQGKNRAPHDHNRDYHGESLYPVVRDLREFVTHWAGGRLRLGLDMHCPYIRGGKGPGSNEEIFFVGLGDEENTAQLATFSQLLEATQTGPLSYRTAHNLPFGEAWNTAASGLERCSANWMRTATKARLAMTLELPYASAGGRPVTATSARAFGADLARTIRRWLATRS
jgi:hypothetical protein